MRIRRKRKGNYPKRRLPLEERHYLAIDMLTEHRKHRMTHEEISKVLGITRMTLYRWEQRPDFKAELQRAINRKLGPIVQRIRRNVSQRSWIVNLTNDLPFIERVIGLR